MKLNCKAFGLIFILINLSTAFTCEGQENKTYWLMLSDKDGMTLDPHAYFDEKAIERRVKNNIPLVEFSDLPVRPDYISAIEKVSDSIVYSSRWLNAVIVQADELQIKALESLEFVTEIWLEKDNGNGGIVAGTEDDSSGSNPDDEYKRTFMKAQLERMTGSAFTDAKIDGNGQRIAIFDIGFKSYKTNAAFKHLRDGSQIIKTWDFARKKENVDGYHSHGCFVLSCIAGHAEELNQNIGLATGAEFLLAITETRTEFFKEEVNWLAAAEWADKNGADIINSSLGYTYHRYFRYDMDGQTSFVAKAAKMASDKGILVVNSAGNEGQGEWKNLASPADVDEVLSVGGISPWEGYHTDFSSFGPTWDKRLKPNVAAYGHVMGSGPKGYSNTQGTSFSSPLVTGFVACVMQVHPDWNRQKVFDEVQKSGDLYPYFDYAHGYGVPQANYFIAGVKSVKPQHSVQITDQGKYLEFKFDSSLFTEGLSVVYGQQLKTQSESFYISNPNLVYYHIENKKGYLDKYVLIDPNSLGFDEEVYKVYKSEYAKPFILRLSFKGQTIEYLREE